MDASPKRANVALLTPYDGGNLGDGAIQDAFMANVRHRLPRAHFFGICLNVERFQRRHAAAGFPLCATNLPFYGMASSGQSTSVRPATISAGTHVRELAGAFLERTPGVRRVWRRLSAWIRTLRGELRHCARAFDFLRGMDLLVVSGGGQLDEEWGGPWGHPWALFKWSFLARLAGVPCAMVSLGVGKLESRPARFLTWGAARLSSYRSFRDEKSRRKMTEVLTEAEKDSVVPDLAYSLPVLPAKTSGDTVDTSARPKIAAVSLIAFAKPGNWPWADTAIHQRYLQEMAKVVAGLLRQDYSVVFIYSSLGDDETVEPELRRLLDPGLETRYAGRLQRPKIDSWQDFVAALRSSDVLVASRLHSIILGFITTTPTVAISFDAKVDRAMEDLGQTENLLKIRAFSAEDVLASVQRTELNRRSHQEGMRTYCQNAAAQLSQQYDDVLGLAGLLPTCA